MHVKREDVKREGKRQLPPMAKEPQTTPLATAYARSLLELAAGKNQSKEMGQELQDLLKVVDSDPAFGNFMANPAISEINREQIINKVFRGRVSDLLLRFLLVANRKGRLGHLKQISAAYDELLEEQMGIIEVDVYVAQRLTSDQLDQVRQKVGAALKREAVVHQYVDESLIGGILVRVEDRLLDASVRAQLRAVRRQLLAARPK